MKRRLGALTAAMIDKALPIRGLCGTEPCVGHRKDHGFIKGETLVARSPGWGEPDPINLFSVQFNGKSFDPTYEISESVGGTSNE